MILNIYYGRFQPPTRGHIEIIRELEKLPGESIVLTTRTVDRSRNPLTLQSKTKVLKEITKLPILECKDIFEFFEKFISEGSYDKINVLCGTDRVKDYVRLQKYTKIPVEVIETKRESIYSGTRAREFAANRDISGFLEEVTEPGKSYSTGHYMYDKITEVLSE